MASLTIDQLKKSLTAIGVQLPPSGAKKSEYIKLYQQHVTINESLGEQYSSDDDTPLSASWNVTSTTSPGNTEAITKQVESLSDDDLFSQLQENGVNTGPVLPNTRRVYELKLVKVLSGQNKENGFGNSHSQQEKGARAEEFSDSDVDVDKVLTQKVTETKTRENRRSTSRDIRESISRDSPKPSSHQFTVKKDTSKSVISEPVKPTKFTFIETVRKGSSERFIEPANDLNPPSTSSVFRSRYRSDNLLTEPQDQYVGSWNPRASINEIRNKPLKTQEKQSGVTTKILGALGIALFLAVAAFLYYQWTVNDPYKLIEDEAEREILAHNKDPSP